MRYFQSILIRCAVCTALLLMAGALPTRAAEWPDSLAAAKSEPPANAAEFIRASLENYRAELEAMCRLYEELGGALPSDAETFFTSAMIPKPSEFTIQVSADVLANPLPTHTDKRRQGILYSLRQTLAHRQNLKGYNLDALRRQAWDSLRKLGISNDYTIDAVIAADGITADLLDLPRMVYVHTSAPAIKVIGGGYGTTTTGVRGVFKVEWDDELAGETNGPLTRLFGDKPGIHDVAAVGYNVFKRSEWKDGKVKIHTVPQKRFPGPRILVVKATALGLEGLENLAPSFALTCLRTPSGKFFPGGRWGRFAPIVQVDAGATTHELKIDPGKLRIKIFDEENVPIRRYGLSDEIIVAYRDARPGVTRFRLESAAAGESALRSPLYHAGLNELKIEIDPEPAGGLYEDTDYTIRAVAHGGASMDGWQATWKGPFLAKFIVNGWWGSTEEKPNSTIAGQWNTPMPFAKSSDADAWTAATGLQISNTGENAWTKERLQRQLESGTPDRSRISGQLLVRSPHETGELSIEFPYRLNQNGDFRQGAFNSYPPALTKIGLQARAGTTGDWHSAPENIDLFTAVNSGHATAQTRLSATFANGVTLESEKSPRLSWRLLVTPPGVVSGLTGDDTLYIPNTVRESTEIKLQATTSSSRLRWYNLPLLPGVTELNSPECTLRVNRLALDSVKQGDKLTYRLYAFGDADMSKYRARWNVRMLNPRSADAAISKDFNKTADGHALSTHNMTITNGVADGYLRSVELVNAEGNTLCTLEAGAALNDPVKVSLYVPNSAPPNSRVMALVYAENLSPELATRARCRWTVASDIGEFEQNDTPLLPASKGMFRSSTFLRVADSADLAGRRPGVRVDLIIGD